MYLIKVCGLSLFKNLLEVKQTLFRHYYYSFRLQRNSTVVCHFNLDRESDGQAYGWKDRQTDGQIDRQVGRQTDSGWIDGQTDTENK